MPDENSNGLTDIGLKCYKMDMAPHGLIHDENKEFYKALLDVMELLRVETLLRECHEIHEKILEMVGCIQAMETQDFKPSKYPTEIIG